MDLFDQEMNPNRYYHSEFVQSAWAVKYTDSFSAE